MRWLPPRLVRRVVLSPIIPVLTFLLLLTTPVVVPVGAFATRYLPGRLRVLRLLWLLIVWMVRESLAVLVLFLLWVASGFGWALDRHWFREQHVRMIGWYLWGLVGTCQRSLGLRVVTETSPGALVVEPRVPSRPMLVLSRHAGAGDSFLLVHLLVNVFDRMPSVVLKDTLQWLPSLDIALNRFPNAFISPNPPPGSGVVDEIGRLAGGLDDDGALVIFPEGGNFTPGRRARAIEKLRDRGLDRFVERAEALDTVLPPRPGGVLRALDANPDADVVVVAHAGLERLSSVTDVLTGLPLEHSIRMAWWHVPRAEIPAGRVDREDWLYAWWERIDTWVEDHREPGVPDPSISD